MELEESTTHTTSTKAGYSQVGAEEGCGGEKGAELGAIVPGKVGLLEGAWEIEKQRKSSTSSASRVEKVAS
jgi:hypothetical protein